MERSYSLGEFARNARQTFHLLSNEQIQCAKKVGGHWVCSRAALLRELGA